MIDTITLSLPKGKYKILEPDDFKDSFEPIDEMDKHQVGEFIRVHKGSLRRYLNPDYSYRAKGEVYPNLTIYESYRKDIYRCNLNISFSCPKLLRGQSIDEVRQTEFTQLINLLTSRLQVLGVIVSPSALRLATTTRVDFCKNILFPSKNKARVFLSRLQKCGYPRLETNLREYANGGKVVRFHSDLFEIVFYLKGYDYLEPLGRSVDRLRTKQEVALAKEHERTKSIPPLVRMEVRFSGKKTVNTHMATALGVVKKDWIFANIFNEEYASRVRQYYWNSVVNYSINKETLAQPIDQDVCRMIVDQFTHLKGNKTQRPKSILEQIGLYYMIKTLGLTETTDIFKENWNKSTWFAKSKMIADFANENLKPNQQLISFISQNV